MTGRREWWSSTGEKCAVGDKSELKVGPFKGGVKSMPSDRGLKQRSAPRIPSSSSWNAGEGGATSGGGEAGVGTGDVGKSGGVVG